MRFLTVVLLSLLPSLATADATDRLLAAEAEKALARDDAALAVAWAPAGAEAAARQAFERARAVARGAAPAPEVAAGYLASVLRQLRDEPPAEATPVDPKQLEAALTRSLERGSSAPLRAFVDRLARRKLDRAIADVRRLADAPGDDLDGTRLYVRAYAALLGYAGRLAAAAAAPVAEQVAGGPEVHERICACDCPECEGADCPPCVCVCVGVEPACPGPDEITLIER